MFCPPLYHVNIIVERIEKYVNLLNGEGKGEGDAVYLSQERTSAVFLWFRETSKRGGLRNMLYTYLRKQKNLGGGISYLHISGKDTWGCSVHVSGRQEGCYIHVAGRLR